MNLGLHEAAELHEILVLKTNCLAKASMMEKIVEDPQLKSLMRQDIQASRTHIEQLRGFLSNSQFSH